MLGRLATARLTVEARYTAAGLGFVSKMIDS